MDDRYAAGLFDGEGYVRISRWNKPNSRHIRYQAVAGIGMTYRPIIEALQAEYGGSLNENRHDLRSAKNRIQFTWLVASRKAYAFLLRVRPYLVVKKDEAEVVLAFQEHIDMHPYKSAGPKLLREDHAEIMAEREALFVKCTAFKKRSFPSWSEVGPVSQ